MICAHKNIMRIRTAFLLASLTCVAADTGRLKTEVNPGRAGVFIDGTYVGPAADFKVARTYQVSPKRLETWRGEWRARGEQLAFPGHAAQSQPKVDAQRIPELERKIGQQAMEIDFLKKVLRRFREQALPIVANGGFGSTKKSGKQRKRRPQ